METQKEADRCKPGREHASGTVLARTLNWDMYHLVEWEEGFLLLRSLQAAVFGYGSSQGTHQDEYDKDEYDKDGLYE